jgi:competence protein ComEC
MNKRKITEGKKKLLSVLLWLLVIYMVGHFVYVYNFSPEQKGFQDLAYVHFVDVGQGDAAIIQGKDFNVLIDAGEAGSGVTEYIDSLGITAFDYVIATHPHSDHIGGMKDVIDQYEIKNFMMPDVVHTTKTFENMISALEDNAVEVTIPQTGDTFGNGEILFTVIAPNSAAYESLNNYSIGLRLDCDERSFLFAGDAETVSEEEMLSGNISLAADVYKVSHHGSTTSTSQAFLDAVDPEIAVISCGKGNSYGHPHKEILKRLSDKDIKILRTDMSGNILLFTDGKNIHYMENY